MARIYPLDVEVGELVEGHHVVLRRLLLEGRVGSARGYLELHETTAEGARREAREEALADIELEGVLAVYSIPRLSQVQVMYRARLVSPSIAAGPESEAVALFGWDEIPWNELAFPSVRWALDDFRASRGATEFAARGNPPGELGNY